MNTHHSPEERHALDLLLALHGLSKGEKATLHLSPRFIKEPQALKVFDGLTQKQLSFQGHMLSALPIMFGQNTTCIHDGKTGVMKNWQGDNAPQHDFLMNAFLRTKQGKPLRTALLREIQRPSEQPDEHLIDMQTYEMHRGNVHVGTLEPETILFFRRMFGITGTRKGYTIKGRKTGKQNSRQIQVLHNKTAVSPQTEQWETLEQCSFNGYIRHEIKNSWIPIKEISQNTTLANTILSNLIFAEESRNHLLDRIKNDINELWTQETFKISI